MAYSSSQNRQIDHYTISDKEIWFLEEKNREIFPAPALIFLSLWAGIICGNPDDSVQHGGWRMKNAWTCKNTSR